MTDIVKEIYIAADRAATPHDPGLRLALTAGGAWTLATRTGLPSGAWHTLAVGCMSTGERGAIEADGAICCPCGNNPARAGFDPCDAAGRTTDPDPAKGWPGTYRCRAVWHGATDPVCGRIIHIGSGDILGRAR